MMPHEDFSEAQAGVLAAMRADPSGPRTITLVDDEGREVQVEAYPANGRWETPEEDEGG
jgi:hypothetical protein